MFEAGFLEMLLIGVIGLLVVGPERLPKVARQIGTWIGKLRRFVSTTKQDLERELHADEMRNMLIMQEEKIRELQNSIKENTDSIKNELSQDANLLRENLDDAKNAAQGNYDHHNKANVQDDDTSKVVLDKPTTSSKPNATLDKASDKPSSNNIDNNTDNTSSTTNPHQQQPAVPNAEPKANHTTNPSAPTDHTASPQPPQKSPTA